MGATISDKIGGIAEVSASATAASIGPSAVLPPASVINTIATTTVVDGALQVEWWNRQAETTAFRFSQAVRQGMTDGRTNQQIIATVRGFIDVSRRDAAALVQTATASVANRAREATFERNLDVIKALPGCRHAGHAHMPDLRSAGWAGVEAGRHEGRRA